MSLNVLYFFCFYHFREDDPMKKEKLEAIEVRIDMLRQDSRLISYRISALEERRHEIQERIKKLKQRAKRAR